MMRKLVVLAVIALAALAPAEVRFGREFGVGTRALSFAGNYTAVANDMSATYWNPAAMAFLPVREFQITLDGFRTLASSDVEGNSGSGVRNSSTFDYNERIRLANLGIMSAIPTIQGGFTMAATYQSPYAFDDSYQYTYNVNRSPSSFSASENYRKYGGLNMWSASFGIQVAPGLAAGLTGSLLTGREESNLVQTFSFLDDPLLDERMDRSYMGYDLRAGILYNPDNRIKAGLRVALPQRIRFREKVESEALDTSDDVIYDEAFEYKGTMKSAPSGAAGIGLTLPWLTISADVRGTMPFTFVYPGENIPDTSQAKYFKLGGGVGIEVPMVVLPAMVRFGYSYDQLDLHSFIYDYDDYDLDEWVWSDDGISVLKDRQTFSAGIGFVTSGTGLELSYGYQTWAIEQSNNDRILKQHFNSHHAMVTFIVRY